MQTVLNFPDVSISLGVSEKLIWKTLPLPLPTAPQSLSLHLQVILASKKNLCLCSNTKAIFLICFAIPDEYLYLHLCYRAAGYCLKLNHKVNCSSPSYPCSDLGSLLNSFVLFMSYMIFATRPLHYLYKVVSAFYFISYCCHPTQTCKFTVGLFYLAPDRFPAWIYLAHSSLLNLWILSSAKTLLMAAQCVCVCVYTPQPHAVSASNGQSP